MGLKSLLGNNGVKGIGGIATLEGLNTLGSNFHSLYDAEVGDLIHSVSGGISNLLDNNFYSISNAAANNPLLETALSGASGLGAMTLSNKVLKDFGLVEEGNRWALKNIARYAINAGATTSAFAAGSAAIPYILGGGIAYWASQHGWKPVGKAAKKLGSGVRRLGKGVANIPLAFANGIGHAFGDIIPGIHKGFVKDEFINPYYNKPAYN